MKTHSINKIEIKLLLNILLFLLATFLYFNRFRTIPDGFFQDTGSIALNAVCLKETGNDEYGNTYPLVIRSLDDYKPPLFTYMAVVLFHLFKPDMQLTRLFSMVLGYLAVVGFLLFIHYSNLFGTIQFPYFYSVAAFCFLFSSWIFTLHRFPAEVTLVSLFMLLQIITTYFIFAGNNLTFWSISNGIVLGLGLYSYHSLKFMFLSFYFICFLVIMIQIFSKSMNPREIRLLMLGFGISIVISLLIALPLLHDLMNEGLSIKRIRDLLSAHGSNEVQTIKNIGTYINGVFFFFEGDANRRHHHGFLGELNIMLLPFLIIGFYYCIKETYRSKNPFWIYILLLIPLCFVPASVVSDGVPHSLRSNSAVLPLFLVSVYGFRVFDEAYYNGKLPSFTLKLLLVFLILSLILNLMTVYWYYEIYPKISSGFWVPYNEVLSHLNHPADIDPSNHSISTIYDRLGRILIYGDLRYCRGGV